MRKRLAIVGLALASFAISCGHHVTVRKTYSLLIDYDRRIEEDILRARIGIWPREMTASLHNLRTARKGMARIEAEVVEFGWIRTTPREHVLNHVLEDLDKEALRPAEFRELVAFYQEYDPISVEHGNLGRPEWFDICAVGSTLDMRDAPGTPPVIREEDPPRYGQCLVKDSQGIRISVLEGVNDAGGMWGRGSGSYFLAVKEQASQAPK